MKSKVAYILLFTILLIVGAFYMYSAKKSDTTQSQINVTATSSIATKTAGTISSNQDGTKQYSNSAYGISFSFKPAYHIGDDNLATGTLQLFNYDENSGFRKGFGMNENKIEAGVGGTNVSLATSDNPEKKRTETEITIAGVVAKRTDVELEGGLKVRTYSIPLRNFPGKYFSISIYGDESNFGDLDKIMEGFKFL